MAFSNVQIIQLAHYFLGQKQSPTTIQPTNSIGLQDFLLGKNKAQELQNASNHPIPTPRYHLHPTQNQACKCPELNAQRPTRYLPNTGDERVASYSIEG